MRINVFGYDEQEKNTFVFPRYISEYEYSKTVNLLLISNGTHSHYILIKNLDTLLRDKTNHYSGMKFYVRCLQSFTTMVLLDSHMKLCYKKQIEKSILPIDTLMNFSNYKNKEPHSLYSDINKNVLGR